MPNDREKIRAFIESHMLDFIENENLDDSINIFESGLVNSLFVMKLLKYIQEEFIIEIDSEDMEISNFNSINNIMNFIEEKKYPARV